MLNRELSYWGAGSQSHAVQLQTLSLWPPLHCLVFTSGGLQTPTTEAGGAGRAVSYCLSCHTDNRPRVTEQSRLQ